MNKVVLSVDRISSILNLKIMLSTLDAITVETRNSIGILDYYDFVERMDRKSSRKKRKKRRKCET